MRVTLTDEEARVLGALVEKSVTTPEYYPLTLNALRAACNQKSSREPVVEYDEPTVARAIEGLKDKHLLWVVSEVGARVSKYRHRFAEAFDLAEADTAALCLLLLRGPQTAGEVRGRAERMHAFATPEEVERTFEALAALEEGPLVVRLPRQPGRKEHRWAHTLCGLPESQAEAVPERVDAAIASVRDDRARIAALEAEVVALREEVAGLKAEVSGLKTALGLDQRP